ncbi:MAG: hemolysin family protein [Ginsengibacter sp.]
MDWTSIIIITLTILLIGFFSGIETAFISASKLSIELRRKQGSYSGRIWSAFMEKSGGFMGTLLLIFNTLLVVYVLLWNSLIVSIRNFWEIKENIYLELGVATIVSTIVLILIQFVFKAVFKAKSNSIIGSGFIAFVVSTFNSIFSWLSVYFVNVSEWIIKYLFNVKVQNRDALFKKEDIEHYIQQLKMSDEEDSNQMNNEIFENVLSLSEKRIRESLIPRKEIVALEIRASLEEITSLFIKTKLSKLVVYEDNIDNIQGYLHHLDLLKNPKTVQEILLPIPVIPESMKSTDLINKFTQERKSIAWVIDEFGGTAGIVTMEDVLEEIFGDINDEYDVREKLIDKQIASNEYIFSGRLELDYLIEKYKLIFRKNEEADTLSGYIINQHESIPRQKDRIIIDNYQFDILNVSDTRIDTVKLKILR